LPSGTAPAEPLPAPGPCDPYPHPPRVSCRRRPICHDAAAPQARSGPTEDRRTSAVRRHLTRVAAYRAPSLWNQRSLPQSPDEWREAIESQTKVSRPAGWPMPAASPTHRWIGSNGREPFRTDSGRPIRVIRAAPGILFVRALRTDDDLDPGPGALSP